MKKYIVVLLSLFFVVVAIYWVASYKNSLRSFEVVVARYNEDVSWLKKEFPNEKITIYNKGEDNLTPEPNWTVIKLSENLGREGDTYLRHIINNYNNLADRTLFLQGYPFDHDKHIYLPLIQYKTRIFNHVFNKCKNIIARCGDSVSAYIKSYYKIDKDRLDYQNIELRNTPHTNSFREGIVEEDLETFIEQVLKRKLSGDTIIGWAMGAQFAVEKETVLRYNVQHYQNLLKTLDREHPEEIYFVDKTWDIIFDIDHYKDNK